jgi:hypothetical protein
VNAAIAGVEVARVAADPGKQVVEQAVEATSTTQRDEIARVAVAPARAPGREIEVASAEPSEVVGIEHGDVTAVASGLRSASPVLDVPARAAAASSKPNQPSTRIARGGDGYHIVTERGERRELASMPEVVDLLVSPRKGKRRISYVEFEGFTASEARGILNAAEVRANARYRGVLLGDRGLMDKRFDVSSVHVSDVRLTFIDDGAAEIEAVMELAVSSESPLLIRIKMAFSRASPEWARAVVAKVRDLIASILTRYVKRPGTPRRIGNELYDQLEKELREHGLRCEIKFQQELADFTIVLRDVEQGHGANRRAG